MSRLATTRNDRLFSKNYTHRKGKLKGGKDGGSSDPSMWFKNVFRGKFAKVRHGRKRDV